MARKRLAKHKDFPPNLYRNTAGYFYYRNPQTKEQKGLGKDRAYAFAEARAANATLANMRPSMLADWVSGKTAYSLAEWLPIYRGLWMDKVEPAQASIRASDSYLRRLEEWPVAKRRLPDITTKMVADYLDEYKMTRGAPASKQMRSKLSDIFRWAETQGLIEAGRSPVTATRVHKITVARERMSLEQFFAIREHAPIWLQNAMDLALVSSQRREDVLNMKFPDWKGGALHVVQSKSGGRTRLALAGDITLRRANLSIAGVVEKCRDSVVSQYMVHHVAYTGTAKPGYKVGGSTLSAAFLAARDEAGVKAGEGRTPVTFHEIRSLSERLYREEYGSEFAQAILGHKTAVMTDKYNDLRGEWKVVSTA